jgi:hypothetical protein
MVALGVSELVLPPPEVVGHLKILKWAHEHGCPWDERTCSAAATGGHFEVLDWALENGCPCNEHTCHSAAEGGHLEALQCVCKYGCPWDVGTSLAAAEGGHLKILQWALENGCSWDDNTWEAAVSGRHLGVLLWARENGFLGGFSVEEDISYFKFDPLGLHPHNWWIQYQEVEQTGRWVMAMFVWLQQTGVSYFQLTQTVAIFIGLPSFMGGRSEALKLSGEVKVT